MVFKIIADFVGSNLSLNEAIIAGKPLILFIIGMVIYSIFIFKFYRFLATRDIFKLNLVEYSRSRWENVKDFVAFLFYILEHLIIFPLFTFFWFIVLSILLIFLSENQQTNTLLLFSMAIVATTRITSYYNEELARDIAKTLPLALLAVFLVSGLSYFSLETAIESMKEIHGLWKTILYYLLFIVCMEIVLRILLFINNNIKYSKFKNKE
ncbi:hypothetical protein HYT56_04090 [Candidatus Woesearchaeota archaeon]|nr:hypothetical protein [Candidatus Woesearchaeota archaeon]